MNSPKEQAPTPQAERAARRTAPAFYSRAKTWWQHWQHEVWSPASYGAARSPLKRAAIILARALYIVMVGARRERIKLRAAALTYVTLLSLVPALAVVFSIFAAFGGMDEIRSLVQKSVIDALAVAHREHVSEQIALYVSNVHAGKLGGFGVAILLLTVVSLLGNIERSFNDIWGLHRDRSVIQRFQVYWPLITLGPVLLGLSLSITAAVEASSVVQEAVHALPILKLVTRLGPLLLAWIFFTLLYVIMPNTRVPAQFALVGGVVAGTFWVIAQQLYALYASYAVSYTSIYGQLAVVPLFILWIYVSWVVALLGAQITFAVQSAKTYEPDSGAAVRPSQRARELAALSVLMRVSTAYRNGGPLLTRQGLLDESMVPPRLLMSVIESLVEGKFLLEGSDGVSSENVFVPGRPLEDVSVAEVLRSMRNPRGAAEDLERLQNSEAGRRLFALIEAEALALEQALGGVSLVDLVSANGANGADAADAADATDGADGADDTSSRGVGELGYAGHPESGQAGECRAEENEKRLVTSAQEQ